MIPGGSLCRCQFAVVDMNKIGICVVMAVALLVAGGAGIHSWQRTAWEKSLSAPYLGEPFVGSLTNRPVSVALISTLGRLEVHESAWRPDPVLAFRSADGALRWARVLAADWPRTNGGSATDGLRIMRLHDVDRGRTGYQVVVSFGWDWGGREAGLIHLDLEGGFKGLRLDL